MCWVAVYVGTLYSLKLCHILSFSPKSIWTLCSLCIIVQSESNSEIKNGNSDKELEEAHTSPLPMEC